MSKLKNPATVFEAESQGLEKTTGEIVPLKPHGAIFLRVGGHVWEETPPGKYVAECSKVDPEFRFMNNRKLALYFIVVEGKHTGKRARLFYNKMDGALAVQVGTDFGLYSKFFQDIQRLFPERVGDGSIPVEIDPVQLFEGKIFNITVALSGKKKQATVKHIEHYIGF